MLPTSLIRHLLSVAGLLLLSALPVEAFLQSIWTPDLSQPGIRWDIEGQTPASCFTDGRLTYRLLMTGTYAIPTNTYAREIIHAFQTWEDETNAVIRFVRGPDGTDETGFTLGFTDNGENTQWGSNLGGALGLSTYSYSLGTPNEFIDTDVAFNRTEDFETANSVENTAIHEIGHSLGLGHSPHSQSVMSYVGGWIGDGRKNSDLRLSLDDRLAIAYLYPAAGYLAQRGDLAGQITVQGADVHLAQVNAYNTDDILVASTVSQLGHYRFQGLPPGSYTLRACPTVQAAGSDYLHQQYHTFPSSFHNNQAPTDFLALVADDVSNVTVTAAQVVTQNLAVAQGTPNMYATFSTRKLSGTTRWRTQAIRAKRGASYVFGIDGGNLPTNSSELAEIHLGGEGLSVGTVEYFATRFQFTLDIAADAPLGARPLWVRNSHYAGERYLVPGYLEVYDETDATAIDRSPEAADAAPGSSNVVLSAFSFTVGSADRLRLREVGLQLGGSCPLTNLVRLGLYIDANTNAELDAGEACIGTNTVTTQTLLYPAHTLDAGAEIHLIVVGDFAASAPIGTTLTCSLAPGDITAWGVASSTPITIQGSTLPGRVVTVRNNADSDGDQVDDSWEQQYFGNLTHVTATSDADRDGFPDRAEFLAGTNPTNRHSALLTRVDATTTQPTMGIVIRWEGAAQRSYRVDRATNLAAATPFVPAFSNIPGVYPATLVTDQTATADGPYYYRVRVEP